jgi:hypothetical protein
MKPTTDLDLERLEEIKDEIKDLVDEARALVSGTAERRTTEAYWIAHILGALDEDHEFLGGSMTTMQDTIDALREESEEDDDEEAAPAPKPCTWHVGGTGDSDDDPRCGATAVATGSSDVEADGTFWLCEAHLKAQLEQIPDIEYERLGDGRGAPR